MRVRRRAFLASVGAVGIAGCLTGQGGSTTRTEANRATTAEPESAAGAATTEDPETTEEDTATSTSTPTPEQRDVSLLLNWKPSGLHVPYYAAKSRGFYADAGFENVDIVTGKGSDFSAKQVGLGNEAFGITSSDQTININTRDLSPVSVGVVMQKSPVVVFTTRETFGGAFESVDQLAGKTVGTGPGMVRILTKLMLERKGVMEDVELVDTGYDTVQRLLSGKIDAAGGVFGDAISARAQGKTVDSVRVADTVPSYGHVVATSESFARDRPNTVRAFLRATARGAAWAQNDPEGGVDALVEANQALSETRAQQRQKWETMAENFMLSETVREEGWGWSRAEPWRVTHDALNDAGLLDGTIDPTEVWTNDYLDADYPYIGSYAEQISE